MIALITEHCAHCICEVLIRPKLKLKLKTVHILQRSTSHIQQMPGIQWHVGEWDYICGQAGQEDTAIPDLRAAHKLCMAEGSKVIGLCVRYA